MRILTLVTLCGVVGCSDRVLKLTDSPDLTITDVKVGRGVAAKLGDTVTTTYTVALPDGTVIMDITGNKSHTWTLGDATVLIGVDESVVGMKPGGVRHVIIPPALHYGRSGHGDGAVPKSTNLILDLKLHAVR